jgi:branched-chain amino acid aminotransferase
VASLTPEIKSSNLLNNLLARREAVRAGAAEGILLNPRGDLAEGAHSNLFWYAGDRVLRTPALGVGILPGITRDKVLAVARGLGISVAEVQEPPDSLLGASEIMLTSTSWEVLSVTRYNGAIVGDGRRGEISRLLHAGLRRLYDDPAETA